MKNLKSHFKFSKQERSGIFFLLLFIILLQIGYFLWVSFATDNSIDSLRVVTETQVKIDILKEKSTQQDSVNIYPFNPNFITDYKGYTLGLSVEEIDRLHSFRLDNKYVNSKEEFQQITQVSDSLLLEIAPFFKFPEWTQKSNWNSVRNKNPSTIKGSKDSSSKKIDIELADLNTATSEDLRAINGIGEKLSARIVKFRDRLNGFLVKEQLNHVYGLEPEVVEKVFNRFKIKTIPAVQRININSASLDDLTQLVYFNYDLAKEIINYRDTNGRFIAFDELASIEGFPTEKLVIIQLYLSLN